MKLSSTIPIIMVILLILEIILIFGFITTPSPIFPVIGVIIFFVILMLGYSYLYERKNTEKKIKNRKKEIIDTKGVFDSLDPRKKIEDKVVEHKVEDKVVDEEPDSTDSDDENHGMVQKLTDEI